MKRAALAAASLIVVSAIPACAFGASVKAGEQKAAKCQSCHGKGGHSQTGQFPILAGQYKSYLVHALQAYRSGERKNAIMNGMAADLSDQDIEDLAAYYASQETNLYTPNIDNSELR